MKNIGKFNIKEIDNKLYLSLNEIIEKYVGVPMNDIEYNLPRDIHIPLSETSNNDTEFNDLVKEGHWFHIPLHIDTKFTTINELSILVILNQKKPKECVIYDINPSIKDSLLYFIRMYRWFRDMFRAKSLARNIYKTLKSDNSIAECHIDSKTGETYYRIENKDANKK